MILGSPLDYQSVKNKTLDVTHACLMGFVVFYCPVTGFHPYVSKVQSQNPVNHRTSMQIFMLMLVFV